MSVIVHGRPPTRGSAASRARASVLFLCTGNAARSVMAGAALSSHGLAVDVATAGTLVIEGQPMSWRTRAALEQIGLEVPRHRSRQAMLADLDRATLVVGLAPEHVWWVRRVHSAAASRTATLARLARDLPAGREPLAERVARLALGDLEPQPWEEVVDPGGGDPEEFAACAVTVFDLVATLAEALRPTGA
jgi:protein-tyrosine-phosphatase